MRGLKSFALLDGFRRRPAARLDPVIDAIMAVAAYAADNIDTLGADLDPVVDAAVRQLMR